MKRKISFCFFLLFIFALSPSYAIRYTKEAYQRLSLEQKTKERLNSFTVQNFKVLHEMPLTENQKAVLTKIIQSSTQKINTDFNFIPQDTYEVTLFQAQTYEKVDSPGAVTSGFYLGKKIRVRFGDYSGRVGDPEYFRSVFVHELTHLAISSMDGGKITRWLGEGLAVYEEQMNRSRNPRIAKDLYERRNEKYRKLKPEQFFEFATRINEDGSYPDGFYEHSFAVTKFMIDEYGFSKIRELLHKMKAGASFSSSFKETYNMTPAQMGAKAYGF